MGDYPSLRFFFCKRILQISLKNWPIYRTLSFFKTSLVDFEWVVFKEGVPCTVLYDCMSAGMHSIHNYIITVWKTVVKPVDFL